LVQKVLISLQNLYTPNGNFEEDMDLLRTRKFGKPKQYLISILLIVLTAILCFFLVDFIGYRAVALMLLLMVSVNAILFDIFPVLVSALMSAIIWNYFFIPPVLTFHIGTPEDGLMFLMYFVIASINAVLTYKIREVESKERDENEKLKTIKLYNTLLNSLSHELRTPISTIIGAVDTLKESKDKLSPNNQTELLSQIDLASIRLNRQVENLLNMSRLESGMLKLNLDWCDLNELIFKVVQKLSIPNSKQKIVFEANEHLPFFKLDTGLMEQVFYNIVYNAIQYTPENTIIEIEALNQSDSCVITISDNGNGFPETEMQFVFDKFYRLPHSKTGGSGLGLSIAKGFITAHNGKIKLENNKVGGAKFTITIPAETTFISSLKHV
jgi:two-component system, OmpR family, sensor histidine kinase KdpD